MMRLIPFQVETSTLYRRLCKDSLSYPILCRLLDKHHNEKVHLMSSNRPSTNGGTRDIKGYRADI